MKREPLITVGTITGIAAAIVALVVAFGIDLTDGQQTAILGAASVVAPLIVAAVCRPRVTPTAGKHALRAEGL